MKRICLSLLGLLVVASSASATGILMPKDKSLPPLAIKNQKITTTIEDNVVKTHVEQVFSNHTNRPLEAVFVFPVPSGANINEFAMMMNGKRVTGEVLEKNKARQIYTSIVSRMQDPGLIEHMGKNLFKASIFPVPAKGDQKIEISYSQVVRPDAGLAEYVYPLKISNRRIHLLGNFSVFVHLKSKTALKNIYSPSHKVDIVRKSDNEAKISFEERGTSLSRNFQLFYSHDKKDIGMNMMSFREKGKDGYFLLMVSPKVELDAKEVVAKDVCFVMDTSGSMSGDKMKQAREALAYCINALHAKDRFNVVRFSTEVDMFAKELKTADKSQKAAAVEYAKKLEARGGTDINGALSTAMKLKKDDKRPYLIVFLTDGHPTIGETDDKEIIKNLNGNNKAGTRVFVWGVGTDLNAVLLDQVAGKTNATSQYVKPGENIEVKVSSFFDKVSSPVLSDLQLDLAGVDAHQIYPRKLSDLFKGQQLTVFGRYRGDGHIAVKLNGMVNGEEKTFTYETKFPKEETKRPFIASFWANRKVGYLLQEIRQNGEKKELVNEVVALAKQFAIVTPYTSYLVVEDEKDIRRLPRPPRGSPRPIVAMPGRRLRKAEANALDKLDMAAPEADDDKDAAPAAQTGGWAKGAREAEEKRKESAKKARDMGLAFNAKSGEGAVGTSEVLQEMKASNAPADTLAVRSKWKIHRVEARNFAYTKGVWVDLSWKAEADAPTKIKYLSNAWFQLMDKDPSLKKVLALGKQVVVVLKSGKVIAISKDKGLEELDNKQLKELFN